MTGGGRRPWIGTEMTTSASEVQEQSLHKDTRWRRCWVSVQAGSGVSKASALDSRRGLVGQARGPVASWGQVSVRGPLGYPALYHKSKVEVQARLGAAPGVKRGGETGSDPEVRRSGISKSASTSGFLMSQVHSPLGTPQPISSCSSVYSPEVQGSGACISGCYTQGTAWGTVGGPATIPAHRGCPMHTLWVPGQ